MYGGKCWCRRRGGGQIRTAGGRGVESSCLICKGMGSSYLPLSGADTHFLLSEDDWPRSLSGGLTANPHDSPSASARPQTPARTTSPLMLSAALQAKSMVFLPRAVCFSVGMMREYLWRPKARHQLTHGLRQTEIRVEK